MGHLWFEVPHVWFLHAYFLYRNHQHLRQCVILVGKFIRGRKNLCDSPYRRYSLPLGLRLHINDQRRTLGLPFGSMELCRHGVYLWLHRQLHHSTYPRSFSHCLQNFDVRNYYASSCEDFLLLKNLGFVDSFGCDVDPSHWRPETVHAFLQYFNCDAWSAICSSWSRKRLP